MYTTYHTVRFRDWVSPSAQSSAARAAVRALRMASPTDQLDQKWKAPPPFIPVLRSITDELSPVRRSCWT
eukprot:2933353-Pyramimonas_sp.AAC.1